MTAEIEQAIGLKGISSQIEDVIQRLCFFAPSGSGEYLRDLHEFLALQSLSMLPELPTPARTIFANIKNSIGISIEYEPVLDALTRLVAKNDVYCSTTRPEDLDAQFRLTPGKRNQLREKLEAEKKIERQALAEWMLSIKKHFPELLDADIDHLVADLKLFAFRLLSQQSIETLQVFYGDEKALIGLLDKFSRHDLSEIWESRSDTYDSIRQNEVSRFFRESTEIGKQYIASLLNSIFILQLTNLDPDCAAIVRSQITQATVFLDTNFVFRLVGLQGPDLFLASKKLVSASQQLGFKLVVSPQTISEYSHTLAEFLREIRGKPVITSELASLALGATNDEDFVTAYWSHVKEKGAYVDPTRFYDYYKYIEQILQDFGIDKDDTYDAEIQARESDLATEESLLLDTVQNRNRRGSPTRISQYVLRHDVHHRLLVLRFREGLQRETFNDARAWFLTCDTKLPRYDRVARSNQRHDDKLPFCVTSGQWMQTLRPLLGGNGEFDVAQVDLLVSPLLRAYQRPPSHLINDIIGRLSMSARYSVPAITAMLADNQFLEQFGQVKDPSAQQDLIDNFYASYADDMEAKAERANEEAKLAREQAEMQKLAIANEREARRKLEVEVNEREQREAQTVAHLQAIQNELLISQSRVSVEQEKVEQTRREKVEQEKRHEAELKLIEERQLQQNKQQAQRILQLRRHIVVGTIVFLLTVLYLFIRQPWALIPPAYLELFGVVCFSLYLIASLILDIWGNYFGRLVTIVAPLAIVVSLLAPESLMVPLQVVAIILPGIHFFFTFRNRADHAVEE